MERIQINAPAAKLRGTVAVLKIYRCNKGDGGKRTTDDKGERGHGGNKGERKRTVDDKGGSERNSHSPITAVE